MSFDLYVFPVPKAMTDRAAARHVSRLAELDEEPDAPTAPGLTAFLADFRQRYPDLAKRELEEVETMSVPVIVDAYPSHAFLSVWWEAVGEVAPFALELAEHHSLALFDPQAEVVHLPPALGPRRPVDWAAAQGEGEAMLGTLTDALANTPFTGDTAADLASATRQMLSSGMRMTDIHGNEFTLDNVEQMLAHPRGLPARLQKPKQRARLFADLEHANPMKRSGAALTASAWDPDPEIITALRRVLADDPDIGVRSMAALSLGNLGDVESFARILELVRDLTALGDKPALDHALSAARGMTDLAPLSGRSAVTDARTTLGALARQAAAVGSQQRREFERMRHELDSIA